MLLEKMGRNDPKDRGGCAADVLMTYAFPISVGQNAKVALLFIFL
jgi:hypothetical protein